MKICFVGLGSIAKRHIKNIKELFPETQIDILRHSQNNTIPDDIRIYIHDIYNDISKIKSYEAIFITNPTSLHYKTLKNLKDFSKNFFIEKPVFETGLEDINALTLRKDGIYYVACPLRYTNVIQYLKNNIDIKKIYSVRTICSSYLPEWRPGIDYRETYSAKRELGGGVSIDLIHEWDYLNYLFGIPKSIKSFITKKSNLEINSDDLAIYIANYNTMMLELHLDYFGRFPIRKIELFCKDDTIEGDLINQKIVYKKNNSVIDLSEERDSYQKKEILHFFDIVNGKIINDNDIIEACKTLRISRNEY